MNLFSTLTHFGVRVAVSPDGALDGLLDDVGHLVDHELSLPKY